eukprot:m.123007 g.123007  ORF g.123007 m.123007 type:complete len:191 (-) comp28953_c0_seq1:189-761(-)
MSPLRWVDRWLWSMQWSSVADCLLLVMTGLIYRDATHSPAQADPNATASTDTVRTFLAPLWSLNETTKTFFFGCIIVIPQLMMLQYRRRRCIRSPRRLTKLQVVGLLMFILGYALRMWAKVVLGRFFTYEISTPDTDTLVTSSVCNACTSRIYGCDFVHGWVQYCSRRAITDGDVHVDVFHRNVCAYPCA